MCEWSCWSTVGSGGQAEGGEAREQWTVLLCAAVGGGERDRVRESPADDRVKEVSVCAGK